MLPNSLSFPGLRELLGERTFTFKIENKGFVGHGTFGDMEFSML